MDYEKRKIEHIELSLRDDVVFSDNCREIYSEIVLVHQAFPGLRLSEVNTTIKFLDYSLEAPMLIEGITGGVPSSKIINESLAKLANKYKIAIEVGSQRPIIKSGFNPDVIDTYRIVREHAVDIPVIGNIGITQLRELSVDQLKHLVDTISADALAIHFNPAQEIIQPGGDSDFSDDILENLRQLVRELHVPIIAKEVGHGLSSEVVRKLREVGVKIFDTAGACGTSWVKIEALRNRENDVGRETGLLLHDLRWGVPTPISLIESRYAAYDSLIIASGGVWNGVYAAKLIALGADLVGFARPILKNLIERGFDGAERFIQRYIFELRTTMFLTGSKDLRELRRAPVILGPRITEYIRYRGVKPEEYLAIHRQGVFIAK